LSLLRERPVASALVRRGWRERAGTVESGSLSARRRIQEDALRLVYVVLSLLPTVAVVTLAWYVVRAISVRVVWRGTGGRRLDDNTA
jgi:hypothetical protein